ncbi:STAS domain-containing protein [Georgenia sp. AZ-5]|uniref:STAS domain-containing protein n=1 Tax=Georgenia sp. AZ-5 TaxID=3367526 RepID=UPI00375414F5
MRNHHFGREHTPTPQSAAGFGEDDQPRTVWGNDVGGDGPARLVVSAGQTRLVLSGELDTSCAAELAAAVNKAVEIGQFPVQVDARRVTFMDSSALSMLAYLAHRTDSRLAMIQPPDLVRSLLEVTSIDEVVDIVEHDPRALPR